MHIGECCAQINLADNFIGSYWDSAQETLIYTPQGPIAIADAIRVSASLTAADLRYNRLDDVAKQGLRDVVKDRASFTLDLR